MYERDLDVQLDLDEVLRTQTVLVWRVSKEVFIYNKSHGFIRN